MKILTLSDSHNKHNEIPSKYIENINGEIDMIIHAGDMSMGGDDSEIEAFLEWYDKLNFKYKILIAGNHDFFFESNEEEHINSFLSRYPSIIYLQDSGVEIEGLKIWGSGVTPWFYDWAFNRKGIEICKHWDMIPSDTQILITHGPVQGYLDKNAWGESVGCPYLRARIAQLNDLKIHICGHIHEGYGQTETYDGKILINASVLDLKYKMKNSPIEIEIK